MKKIHVEKGKSFREQTDEVRSALISHWREECTNYFEYFLRKEYDIKLFRPQI